LGSAAPFEWERLTTISPLLVIAMGVSQTFFMASRVLRQAERRALHDALDEGIAAARAGDHSDAEAFANELLARSRRSASLGQLDAKPTALTDGVPARADVTVREAPE
jgi:predicted transcriptional regulator